MIKNDILDHTDVDMFRASMEKYRFRDGRVGIFI